MNSQSPFILGHDNQNVPRILAIFATALKEDTLSGNSEVHSRVLTILRHINVSPLLLPETFSQMDLKQIFCLYCGDM